MSNSLENEDPKWFVLNYISVLHQPNSNQVKGTSTMFH